MNTNSSAYKYKSPFRGPHEIVQMWTNRTVTLRAEAVITRINIRHIKSYRDTDVERHVSLQEKISIHI